MLWEVIKVPPEQESVSLGTMETNAIRLIPESGLVQADSMTTTTPVETKPCILQIMAIGISK